MCANKARENSKQHRVRNAIRPHPRVRDLGSRGRRMQSRTKPCAREQGLVPDPHKQPSHMVLMLVHLQGAAAIFRVGRHHHRWTIQLPFSEGLGLANALTDTPPTDHTVATHSPLGAQLQSDRILRLYRAAGWSQPLP